MAKDFSVFDSLGDFAPKLDQNEEIYRDPYELIPSNNNFYSPQVVDELAESILQFGQLQPVVIDSRDGKDYVIAGHTRRLAMIKLIEEGHEKFRKMKCQYLPRKEIEDKFGEDADLAIELIEMQTNLYREKTDWEKMQEVIRTEEIVKKMKTSGRLRDNVQKILKVSGGQQGRFHAIHSNLYGQLMEEFKENRIKGSVAYELSKLSAEFQKQACEIFQRDGNLSLEDTKKLQAQENAEKSIPGQMSIAQATGQLRPTADTTPINVDTQIKRLYDKAQKRLKERVENRDKMMVPMRLRDLYNGSRVQNGYLNYRAEKSCIVFNPDSEQEKELHWNDLADILIQKYGKEPRPVKMTTIDAPEPVITLTESAAETPDEKQQEDHFVDLNKMVKHLRNTDKIPDAWPEDLKDIPVPTDVEIIGYLYDEERRLKEFLETEKEDPGLPHMAILKQQLIVGGLRIIKNLVEDCKEEPEESEQPPLPIMKNNDQRKEWLRNYKSWGLWYEDKNVGIKYYKYDFANGARLIVEEFAPDPSEKSQWYTPGERHYMHLVGGPKPEYKNDKGWNYHSRYNKYQNSETELVEFLKEIQK